MAITPIGPRVLIKPYKQEEKTKGGIYIPDSAKERNSPSSQETLFFMVDTARKRLNLTRKTM